MTKARNKISKNEIAVTPENIKNKKLIQNMNSK